ADQRKRYPAAVRPVPTMDRRASAMTPDSSASVPAEHEGLERKDQRLQPKDDRMHERQRIDPVKDRPPHEAGTGRGDHVMIAGIGVGNAAAALGYTLKTSLVQRLQIGNQRARL